MNQRPSGYEPDELPDCSIPHQHIHCIHQTIWFYSLVRKGGLEPPRPKALPPQGSVSTNSTTTAAVTHSMRNNVKKKALFQLIRQFLVQLVKFHPNWLSQVQSFVRISNYRLRWFAVWQIPPKSNW